MAETPLAFHRHALTRPTGLRRRLLAELVLQHDDGAVESRLTTHTKLLGSPSAYSTTTVSASRSS